MSIILFLLLLIYGIPYAYIIMYSVSIDCLQLKKKLPLSKAGDVADKLYSLKDVLQIQGKSNISTTQTCTR